MNKEPDPTAQTRTRDPGLNAARDLMPDSDPALVALAAVLMNRGLMTVAEIRDKVMLARAVR